MFKSLQNGSFEFDQQENEPVGTVLYEKHLALAGKSRMADFAGFLLPLRFSSIAKEHQAVRQRAGIFDCTHMGTLEITGPEAGLFLEEVTTNRITDLPPGQARYAFLLDAAGNILDDIIIYARDNNRYMVVVNAANKPKVKAYLNGLLTGKIITDTDQPQRKITAQASVRDMNDPQDQGEKRVDIALQGPRSLDAIKNLDPQAAQKLSALKWFHHTELEIAGKNCIVSATGYTGQHDGYEIFIDPAQAGDLWTELLEAGKEFGIEPCGLGSRDSLRIEAGLPLYGHELNGKFNINPFEAGYNWAVKLDKSWFIGKAPMVKAAAESKMTVARIALPGQKGIRPARTDDGILINGKCKGWVLSSAGIETSQIALAYIEKQTAQKGQKIGIYYTARNPRQIQQGRIEKIEIGQKVESDLEGEIVSRFAKFGEK